jgi:hypothetical protein
MHTRLHKRKKYTPKHMYTLIDIYTHTHLHSNYRRYHRRTGSTQVVRDTYKHTHTNTHLPHTPALQSPVLSQPHEGPHKQSAMHACLLGSRLSVCVCVCATHDAIKVHIRLKQSFVAMLKLQTNCESTMHGCLLGSRLSVCVCVCVCVQHTI